MTTATKKSAAKKSAARAKAAAKPQAKKTAKPVEPIISDRSAAISAAMLERSEERQEARAKRGGVPAKCLVFDLWFKAIQSGKALDVEATAKKYPEVLDRTISAWCNAWRNLNNLPSNGKGKEKMITAALKKTK